MLPRPTVVERRDLRDFRDFDEEYCEVSIMCWGNRKEVLGCNCSLTNGV